jgi:uncharacterized protein
VKGSDKDCVLLFVKVPEKGTVKSRLSKDLGEDTALSLYENFVLDILATLKEGRYPFNVCFHPPDSPESVQNRLWKNLSRRPQRGKNLGERMKNAFSDAFSDGFDKVVLIGSDIPDLTNSILDIAFAFTDDAVIGPAMDGGYYLIGFRKKTFLPDIFEGIHWGTASVFEQTMEIFKTHNLKVRITPKWQDVDRLDDLKALVERNRDTEFADSMTMAYIKKRSLWLPFPV